MSEHPAVDAKTIFLDAVELPAEQRRPFLDGACRGDAALRERVEALLRSHEEAGTFMRTPTHTPADGAPRSRTVPAPGRGDSGGSGGSSAWGSVTPGSGSGSAFTGEPLGRIGRYTLWRRLGEGAFGEVYQAEQTEPVRRTVALKVLKLGADSSQVLARFDAERQALALLDHPNIARFLDAGAADDGRPYFVMDLVRGQRITDHCDDSRATLRDRVALFIGACRGVQHAHDAGLVHRDLKPGNVLVEVRDDRAVARVIDFGIARALAPTAGDDTGHTQHGQVLGTPAYMSPEQALGSPDVDARSDVWSLGCLLHELLVGATPIPREELRRAGFAGARQLIQGADIPSPSERAGAMGEGLRAVARNRGVESTRLALLLRGELDWIAGKALSRDRADRYANAGALADDLQRWLDRKAVEARPRSARGPLASTRRLVRRHSGRVPLAAAAGLALLAAVAWFAGLIPGVPGLGETAARRAGRLAGAVQLGLPEGAWVNGTGVNRAAGAFSLVAGGKGNTAARDYAGVGGGLSNTAGGFYAVVGGGEQNMTEGDRTTISGGSHNRASGEGSTVAGGRLNIAVGADATVGGGTRNEVKDYGGAVGGGNENFVHGKSAVVAGGRSNKAYDMQTAIGGGYSNRIGLPDSDQAHSDGSVIGGGINNEALCRQTTIAGGIANRTISDKAAIGGGSANTAGSGDRAGGSAATVSGGEQNTASGANSTVPGGLRNTASGRGSFAAGTRATAQHDGAFVWSDATGGGQQGAASTAPNSFVARARGGFHMLSGNATSTMLRAGEGSWSQDLSEATRVDRRPADARDLLTKVAQLNIETFRYAEQAGEGENGVRHVGPAGEQFHAVFGLGVPGGHTSGGNLDGVALAAIQGLLERVEAQQALIEAQARRLEELERRVGGVVTGF